MLLVALCAAGARLAWVASRYETGWETVGQFVQAGLPGPLGSGFTPLSNRDPAEQADVLLAEAERITSRYPDSAAMHMAAAWMLDQPAYGFAADYWVEQGEAFPPFDFGIAPDRKRLAAAEWRFEKRCREKRLALAARATELAPDKPLWWRMRAELLFEPPSAYRSDFLDTRTEDWLAELDECARHDPDNALYDYVAALRLWEPSAREHYHRYGSMGQLETELVIYDEEMFAEGMARFEAGLGKEYVAAGEAGTQAIVDYLAESRLSQLTQVQYVKNRGLHSHAFDTVVHLVRTWQRIRAEEARKTGDAEAELAILQQKLHILDQGIRAGGMLAVRCQEWRSIIALQARMALIEIAQLHPRMVDEGEFDAIPVKFSDIGLSYEAILYGANEALAPPDKPDGGQLFVAGICGAAIVAASFLFLIAALTLPAAWVLRREPERRSDGWLLVHFSCWAIGLGCSIVVLGMLPGSELSAQAQGRIVVMVSACIVVVAGGALLWDLLRRRSPGFQLIMSAALLVAVAAIAVMWPAVQLILPTDWPRASVAAALAVLVAAACWWVMSRRPRFHLISLFALITVGAVIGAQWPVIRPIISFSDPLVIRIPARGLNGIGAEPLRLLYQSSGGDRFWAFAQWTLYHGVYASAAVSLVLTAICFAWYEARANGEPVRRYWTRAIRSRWPSLLRLVGWPALAAGLCCMLLFMVLVPNFLPPAEERFQYDMYYLRDTAGYRSAILERAREIEAEMEAGTFVKPAW